MVLNITTTHFPATDFGYLLGKHPDRWQTKELNFGKAHVFYPEATAERCTVCLMLEMDTTAIIREKVNPEQFLLAHYINDRSYVASSFLSTALSKVFGSAMNGNCKDRPELVNKPIPLEVELPVVPCRANEELVAKLFEPLGYSVKVQKSVLDGHFPEWGESPYLQLRLSNILPLRHLLSHLYILIPVLDNKKHYFIGGEEVEKLVAKAGTWLPNHPERDLIVNRYMKYKPGFTQAAKSKMFSLNEEKIVETTDEGQEQEPPRLHNQRHEAVVEILKKMKVRSVADLGCGSGKLLQKLMQEKQFEKILGLDVSTMSLEIAAHRLGWHNLPERQKARLQLVHGALTYRDRRIEGFDAHVLIEVVEHLDPFRLEALEQVVFGQAGPALVILTTPNSEYNVLYKNLPKNKWRHPDHRFEWTRKQAQKWAQRVSQMYGYSFLIEGIGPIDRKYGAPTQMLLFQKSK